MKKFFTLIAAALMAVGANAQNHALKITGTADKNNTWDIQCFINLKNVQKGKPNVVKFDIYTSAKDGFKMGTEAIDDAQQEHKTEWNASAVFNYTNEIALTTDVQEAVVNFPGVTTVTCHSHCTPKDPTVEVTHQNGDVSKCDAESIENFEYAATAILLNIGMLPAGETIIIDNMKVYDADGTLLSTEDFENATVAEYDASKTVYYPGWQNAATYEIAEDETTGISQIVAGKDAANGKSFNLAGQQVGKDFKGIVVKNGKKMILK